MRANVQAVLTIEYLFKHFLQWGQSCGCNDDLTMTDCYAKTLMKHVEQMFIDKHCECRAVTCYLLACACSIYIPERIGVSVLYWLATVNGSLRKYTRTVVSQ